MKTTTLLVAGTAIASPMLTSTPPAHAATISNGAFSVGVGPNGELWDSATSIGFQRLSDGYDPLDRDSWGINANGAGAFADYRDFGTSNILSAGSFVASSGTVISNVLSGTLSVTQAYSFVMANVLKIDTTVTNTSGTAQAVLFQRDVNWNVPPTEYNENTFAPAIPSGTPVLPRYRESCAAGCNQTSDLGGGIMLNLGTLAAGASDSFFYLYGISQLGETVNGLNAQLNGAGAAYVVSTQSSENGSYPNLGKNSAAIGATVMTGGGGISDSSFYGFENPNPGSATGDPHFTTYDGLHYDFQGLGEFLLTKSTVAGDSFDVQIQTSPGRKASFISEVAAKLGHHTITFDLDRAKAGESFVWIDGRPSSLGAVSPAINLDGGRIVETSPKSYQVVWDTGETFDVTNAGACLNVSSVLSQNDPPGSLEGLLGSDSGWYSDLRSPEAWRVSGATSLFDSPAVPEPATLSLLGIGLVGLGMIRRRTTPCANGGSNFRRGNNGSGRTKPVKPRHCCWRVDLSCWIERRLWRTKPPIAGTPLQRVPGIAI